MRHLDPHLLGLEILTIMFPRLDMFELDYTPLTNILAFQHNLVFPKLLMLTKNHLNYEIKQFCHVCVLVLKLASIT